MYSADLKQRILDAGNTGLSFSAEGIAGQLGESIADCFQAIQQLYRERSLFKIEGKEDFYGVPEVIAAVNREFKSSNQTACHGRAQTRRGIKTSFGEVVDSKSPRAASKATG
jgi:hypothetical protein